MKFFIPDTDTAELAEQTYDGIQKFARIELKWNIADRRIFRIYFHDNKDHKVHVAEVGTINDVNSEVVFAILESNAYLVCTPNRGVLRDTPILIGKREVRSVEDFEG